MTTRVGIEKEYTFVAQCLTDNELTFVLASRDFFTLYRKFIYVGCKKSNILTALLDKGWKVEPEYSHAIIEIISPPKTIAQLDELVTELKLMESILVYLVNQLAVSFQLPSLTLSDSYSAAFGRFMDLGSNRVCNLHEILLDPQDANKALLITQKFSPPFPCQTINFHDVALRFAGFTSLNITLSHSHWFLTKNRDFNDLFYHNFLDFLRKSVNFYTYSNGNRGRNSCRNDILNWIDLHGRWLIEYVLANSASAAAGKKAVVHLFGAPPYEDDVRFKSNYLYAARPRIYNNAPLIEFRCFDSAYSPDEIICCIKQCYTSAAPLAFNS